MVLFHRHYIVEGHVQGVGFRWHTQKKALEYGIVGWVRNLPDSNVEVVAEGEKSALELFEGHVKMGPPAAEVERVVTLKDAEIPSFEFSTFSIRK